MRFIYRRILISRSIITTRSNTFTYLIYTPTNNFTTNPNVITTTFTYLNPTTNNNYYTDSRRWRRASNRSTSSSNTSSNRIKITLGGVPLSSISPPYSIITITTITTASSHDFNVVLIIMRIDDGMRIDGEIDDVGIVMKMTRNDG